MHSDKKRTKEDTWRPDELRKYIRETGHGDNSLRRRGLSERQDCGGDTADRQLRDKAQSRRDGGDTADRQLRDKEQSRRDGGDTADRQLRDKEQSRRDGGDTADRQLRDKEQSRRDGGDTADRQLRDKAQSRRDGGDTADRQLRDKEQSRRDGERGGDEEKKYAERRKEGSQDRRGDKGGDRHKQIDAHKHIDSYRENRDRKQDREERHERIRDKERHGDKEKDRATERDRHKEGGRDISRDDRDKLRRRQEQDREHRSERERGGQEASGDRKRDETEKYHRDHHRDKEQHRNEYKEIQERRGSRKSSERKEDKEDNQEHRKSKEALERGHRERRHHDERRKHDSESRQQKDITELDQDVRHLRRDRESIDKEGRHRDDGDLERKHRDRRHREEDGPERKPGDRRHREEDGPERKPGDRRHREEDGPERKPGDRRHRDRRHREEDGPERKPGDRRHREEDGPERKHRDRRHREEDGPERKHRDRRHREEDGPERKPGDRRHREEDGPERKPGDRRHREEDGPERKPGDRRHREEDGPERKPGDRRHREEDGPERKPGDRRHREEDGPERKPGDRRHRADHDQDRKPGDRRQRKEEEYQVRKEKDDDRSRPDSSSSKTSSAGVHGQVEMGVRNTEEVKDTDSADREYEYEDDFEKVDYEEDFEEVDESSDEGEDEEEEKEKITVQQRKEIEAIQRAIDEENERVGTVQSRQSSSREEEDRPKCSRGSQKNQSGSSQHGRFIDFVAAKKREVSKQAASKQKKRSTELLRLIDLDFSTTLSLLDLPPVSEYDMYIRKFGTANTKQAYAQSNEDSADRDIQTQEVEMCEKWTQHPSGHSGACGDPNLSQEVRHKTKSDLNFDSQRLTSFLCSASQVMVVLLEEDQAERNSLRKVETQKDTLSFSHGSLQLHTELPFLDGRQVSLLHFSQVQRHTMMSVHTPTAKPGAVRLDSCAIICIWNIWEPSRPQKILVYEAEVKCCCFSPGKATLVFAGTSVGSVVLWDLREPGSSHCQLKMGEEEWTFRQPTFSTDAVMAGLGHFSPVCSIEVAPSAGTEGLRPEVPLLASEEELSGLSFQLASLDESGALNFWVVVELPKGNEAGSPADLGLRPGSKVKLLHSSFLLTAERASPGAAVKTAPLQTLLLKFFPTDSSHFCIGTNMGLVSHGTSHGLKALPKFYRFHEVEVRPVDVSSIHFSPFRHNLFLVGCADGSIRLHSVGHQLPLAQWTDSTSGVPVVSLQWASTRPTVFCVLDAGSNLHIWDLIKNDTEPVISERVGAARVMAMAVFGDFGQQNTYSGIALAYESGKIEVQYFSRDFTVSSPAEEDKLESLMTEV